MDFRPMMPWVWGVVVILTCVQDIVGDSLDSITFPSDDNTNPSHHQGPSNARNSARPAVKPRFWFNDRDYDGNDGNDGDSGNSFNVHPSSNGGFSGSGSFSNNYAGNGHSAGHSQSFSFSAGQSSGGGVGFSASQSASQAASFNQAGNRGPSLAGSQASQSSSFSGTSGGFGGGGASSAASSQAASVGFAGPGVAGAGANRHHNNNKNNNFGASLSSSSANSQNAVTSFGGNVGNTGSGHRNAPNLIPADFIRSRPGVVNNRADGRASKGRRVAPFYDLYSHVWSTLSTGTPRGRSVRRQYFTV